LRVDFSDVVKELRQCHDSHVRLS